MSREAIQSRAWNLIYKPLYPEILKIKGDAAISFTVLVRAAETGALLPEKQ
jgi:hypothetical protein